MNEDAPAVANGSTWWAPRSSAWWVGVLFMIGSACFALGSVPAYDDAVGTGGRRRHLLRRFDLLHERGLPADAGRLETCRRSTGGPAVCSSRARSSSTSPPGTRWSSQPHRGRGRPHDLASRRVRLDLLPRRERARGLRARTRWVPWCPRARSWWIATLNMVGSIAFGVSARRVVRGRRQRRAAQRRTGQPRHAHRRAVLPGAARCSCCPSARVRRRRSGRGRELVSR